MMFMIMALNMKKVKISDDLLLIKNLIGKPRRDFNEEMVIKTQLSELGHKIEDIEKKIYGKGNFDLKKINEIVFLLKNQKMNSSEVGKVLKLSRNRASEYLKKMEIDKILKSSFAGKKKFYTAAEKGERKT